MELKFLEFVFSFVVIWRHSPVVDSAEHIKVSMKIQIDMPREVRWYIEMSSGGKIAELKPKNIQYYRHIFLLFTILSLVTAQGK